ncbi:hypothetical protein, partial [Nocardia cyriacigeorgica]|uniref:hypothetical protein n=1 Tax=Nocardia cyriacigeorgica TaxID=135487 RepID=UPI002455D952
MAVDDGLAVFLVQEWFLDGVMTVAVTYEYICALCIPAVDLAHDDEFACVDFEARGFSYRITGQVGVVDMLCFSGDVEWFAEMFLVPAQQVVIGQLLWAVRLRPHACLAQRCFPARQGG